ncbi:hypothetical protein A8F94_19130 [Bacillus sp. FJAT-27225]|uniref:hypothetical protein n=1 Tax=Bacillus sp. FJAT-27225 TaxID=1743144 RepID=UPI00080C2DE5|nr:hypothetical protein [Bacillus sp. FJAT-27225]OCA83222.1 hypothetical protein A8F94_19130 [Bacillus sp. FJAT-27225]
MGRKLLGLDHGIPVQAEEERTAAFCIRDGKSRLVIAAKGFAVIIDPENGDSKQVLFPGGNKEYPFSSFSSKGLFYTGAGNMLLVLDPFIENFIFHKTVENGEEIVGFSFAEDEEGLIYFTTYPHCHLLSYCPDSSNIVDYGSMDPSEKYPGSLAADRKGWLYIGIGTERKNIIAFQPSTGIKKSLVPKLERKKGAGHVYPGIDGGVYGHWQANDMREVNHSSRWLEFSGGTFREIADSGLPRSFFFGAGFQKVHRNHESGYQIRAFSLAEGYAILEEKETGREKQVKINYQSGGATLSTLFTGPDGYLYGTSMHPLQLFRYDFISGDIVNYGGEVIEEGGGGNIPAYASQGNVIIGAAYAGGKLYRFDTKQPVIRCENPRLIFRTEDIHRPRCAISISDHKTVVWGGFPGYGMVGGGLGIYNVETDQAIVINHKRLIPNQSTISLGELSTGEMVGGTSIDTPGGARTPEKEACLYLFDWKRQSVIDRFVPVKGAREIVQIFVDPFDRVHCLTDESLYFVCDPFTREILFQQDLSNCGAVVRNGFAFERFSGTLYLLLERAVLSGRMGGSSLELKVNGLLPFQATSGVALYKGRIFYGSGSHLCSVDAEME